MSISVNQSWVSVGLDDVKFLFAQPHIKGVTVFEAARYFLQDKNKTDHQTLPLSTGTVNWKGAEIPVLSLSGQLHLLSIAPSSRRQAAIFELGDFTVALAADEVEPLRFDVSDSLVKLPACMQGAEYPVISDCCLIQDQPYFRVHSMAFSDFIFNKIKLVAADSDAIEQKSLGERHD